MGTADELLDQMFSWIEKMESCAEKLRKLAKELESLREKCNAGECYGNSVAVVGSACLIGAGALTLLTGGLAAPVLAGVGAACTGVGVTITVATKIIEDFISSDTMIDAQKIYENSNDIGEKIQQLFQKLKNEKLKMKRSADPDELDQHVFTELLTAMGRRFGLEVNISSFRDEYQRFSGGGLKQRRSFLKPEFMIPFTGILAFFSFEAAGKQSKLLFAEGVKQFIKEFPLAGFKAFLKGGGLVVGGAVGMVFSLPDAIKNWTDLIKKNNVTEASKSLRDTADGIRKMTKTLRKQLGDMKRMLEEEEKRAREEEEKKRARENTTQQHQRDESDREEEESDSEEEESDREEEESDREEEESDREEEESDSEEQESDREEEESDREEEDEESGKKLKKKLIVAIKSKPIPPGTINMWLLNTHSMCNKTEEIKNIITENKVDVFNSTETHLRRPDGNQVIKEATPTTHKSFHQMRLTKDTVNVNQERKKKGGGVAIQCDKDLQGERRRTNRNPETFEYVAAEMQHDEWIQPVLFINVYRPPGLTKVKIKAFLKEFKKFLDEISVGYDSIIITGDFNIHVDVDRGTTRMFEEFLEENNLIQHVVGPTHRSGHTLDLVITRNVEISDLRVRRDIDISDHYPVTFNARPVLMQTSKRELKLKKKTKKKKM